MKGIILSGGRGTRLRPITHTGPKQLVPIANKPVIQYVVQDLKDAGITEIGVVLGEKGAEEIQEFLGDGTDFGVDITYIYQGAPLGLAHAVGCAQEFVGDDDFVVYLGDNLLNNGISDLVDEFNNGGYDAGIALQEVSNPGQFGVAKVDETGAVESLVEKPDSPPSNLALIGVYMFSPKMFDVIQQLEPSWRGELEITEAIQKLIESERSVGSHVVQGWWKDTGKPSDVLEANRLVLDESPGGRFGEIEATADVTGHVDLAETARIESGAVVRGPVSIGPESVVGSDSYIGPYTSLGADTIVENAHIENSVIVGDALITTEGKITDSLLGSGTEVDSAEGLLPEGKRLIVGENANLKL